jgi:hypothetical protein
LIVSPLLLDRITIDYLWKGKDSFISILDNGKGMNLGKLIITMTPGNGSGRFDIYERLERRFGMGLKRLHSPNTKTLQLLQKKRSFKTIKRCWDIDFINQEEEWTLLDFISRQIIFKRVDELSE